MWYIVVLVLAMLIGIGYYIVTTKPFTTATSSKEPFSQQPIPTPTLALGAAAAAAKVPASSETSGTTETTAAQLDAYAARMYVMRVFETVLHTKATTQQIAKYSQYPTEAAILKAIVKDQNILRVAEDEEDDDDASGSGSESECDDDAASSSSSDDEDDDDDTPPPPPAPKPKPVPKPNPKPNPKPKPQPRPIPYPSSISASSCYTPSYAPIDSDSDIDSGKPPPRRRKPPQEDESVCLDRRDVVRTLEAICKEAERLKSIVGMM